MERWSGRVALVTGASSGIGAATVRELVKQGLKVVGVARRVERIEELSRQLSNAPGKLYAIKGDVSNETDILNTFEWIKKNLGGVDILINNAGVADIISLTDPSTEKLQNIFSLNVIGLSICTREAIKSMKERGVDDGHIININSVAGHYIFNATGIHVYTATKHAVTVLTEGLRRELVQQKSKIKVTSISPGTVDTEMLQKTRSGLASAGLEFEANDLKSEDISDAVLYVLGTPPHVQVHEIMIRPVGETV